MRPLRVTLTGHGFGPGLLATRRLARTHHGVFDSQISSEMPKLRAIFPSSDLTHEEPERFAWGVRPAAATGRTVKLERSQKAPLMPVLPGQCSFGLPRTAGTRTLWRS